MSAKDVEQTMLPTVLTRYLQQCSAEERSAITVFFPYAVSGHQLRALLIGSGVRSVIYTAEDAVDEFRDSNRVGLWNPFAPLLRFPRQTGRVLLFVGRRDQLFFRLVYEALLKGALQVVVLSPSTGIHARYPAAAVVASTLGARLGQVGARAKARLIQRRGRFGWSRSVPVQRRGRFGRSRSGPGPSVEAQIEVFRARFETPLLSPDEFRERKVHYCIGSLGRGGAERQMVNTLLGIQSQGHGVAVFCEYLDEKRHDFYLDYLQAKQIPVFKVDDERYRELLASDDPTLAGALQALTESFSRQPLGTFEEALLPYIAVFLIHRPRVLHAWLDAVNIKAGLAALAVGVPKIILSQRSMAPYHFELFQPYMEVGYSALAKSPRVSLLNNSEAGADDYAHWIGIARPRITVIHNGLHFHECMPGPAEAATFRQFIDVAPDTDVVGTVIRFSEEKEPILWLEVAREIVARRPATHFVMVGDGPLRSQCEAMTTGTPLEGRVRFPGETREPLVAIAAMDVFLLTSRMEGLPNVLIEAQSVGTPVVTRAVGGAGETIREGVTGFAVRSADARQLAERIISVLDNPEWRATASVEGQRYVQDKFNYMKMVQQTLATYDGLPVEPAPNRGDRSVRHSLAGAP